MSRGYYGDFSMPTGVAEWQDRANCLEHDPDMWSIDTKNMSASNRRAIIICQTCPVTAECLEAALPGDKTSIRGGLTPIEQANARRRATRRRP